MTVTGARMHANALRLAQSVGRACTFTETTQAYDPTTGTYTASAVQVAGYAVRDNPTPEFYQALGLTVQGSETLLFSPSTFGEEPEIGATVVWGDDDDDTYTVKQIERIGPNSTASLLRVVLGR